MNEYVLLGSVIMGVIGSYLGIICFEWFDDWAHDRRLKKVWKEIQEANRERG